MPGEGCVILIHDSCASETGNWMKASNIMVTAISCITNFLIIEEEI
jgi:hypothetical protein